MAGIAFLDLFMEGAVAGIAAGQPFIAGEIGNSTQTNFEAYYNILINNNIHLTPLLQVITDASNQSDNGIIWTGTLRTIFSFIAIASSKLHLTLDTRLACYSPLGKSFVICRFFLMTDRHIPCLLLSSPFLTSLRLPFSHFYHDSHSSRSN